MENSLSSSLNAIFTSSKVLPNGQILAVNYKTAWHQLSSSAVPRTNMETKGGIDHLLPILPTTAPRNWGFWKYYTNQWQGFMIIKA